MIDDNYKITDIQEGIRLLEKHRGFRVWQSNSCECCDSENDTFRVTDEEYDEVMSKNNFLGFVRDHVEQILDGNDYAEGEYVCEKCGEQIDDEEISIKQVVEWDKTDKMTCKSCRSKK